MTSDETDLASALRPAILRLGRRLRQMQDESAELTASQSSLLGVLLAGGLTMGQLAAAEKVQPPTITRVVKGLEERGLVAREPVPHDGRQSQVVLTENGRALLAANRQVRNVWLTQRIAELDAAEQDLLRRAVPVLTKLNSG